MYVLTHITGTEPKFTPIMPVEMYGKAWLMASVTLAAYEQALSIS